MGLDPGIFPAKKALEMRPVALVLAAGRARRFGHDKRQALVYQSETLLEASLRCYLEARLDVLVCLSSRPEDDNLVARLSPLPVRVLRCHRAGEGMGATLAEGILECRGYPGAFIALGDMPCIRPATLRQLEAASGREVAVVPTFRGRRGHPVLFGDRWYRALSRLGGDRGAAGLLALRAAQCVDIEVDDPGIHLDADTQEELAALPSSLGAPGVTK